MGRSKTIASRRQERARKAQLHLEQLISSKKTSQELQLSAVKHIWALGKRHRIGIPQSLRHWICRKCIQLYCPGSNSRVRIRDKVRTITCFKCGTVRRYKIKTNQ